MPREAAIVKAGNEEVRSRGGWVRKPAKTEAGDPDVHGCYRGLFVAIEYKQPGESPSRLQLWTLGQIRAAGGRTCIARSRGDVSDFLDAIDAELDHRLAAGRPRPEGANE